jgi:hypothetical protein
MAPLERELVIGQPCDPARAEPLHIVAHLAEGIVLRHQLAIDALLAWATAAREQVLPPLPGDDAARIEIPIMREPAGRFHLCSLGFAVPEQHELRYKNKRAPAYEYARFGTSKIRRVDIGAGPNKGERKPYELQLLEGDRIEWWALGDAERIRARLSVVHYLGKHRGNGKGRLDLHGTPWAVDRCEPWGDGFPVARAGKPMRTLPLDYPGLRDPRTAFRPLSYPYFDRTQEELLAVP